MADDRTDAVRLRSVIARADRLLARRGVGEGLTRTQLSILGAVTRGGPTSLGSLADREGVNPTMLSRIVGSLTTAGLLERRPNPDDGRQGLVEVTAAGKALHERLLRDRTALLSGYVDALPAADARTLHDALDILEGLVEHLLERAQSVS
ncbi:MAG: hypothetical protein QOF57_932 [Frankiaceae bacterium]|jgi:DNA-binding MarR family transcriptional regulator|nr:hypothetical protein [Frankiaceae bacterium]